MSSTSVQDYCHKKRGISDDTETETAKAFVARTRLLFCGLCRFLYFSLQIKVRSLPGSSLRTTAKNASAKRRFPSALLPSPASCRHAVQRIQLQYFDLHSQTTIRRWRRRFLGSTPLAGGGNGEGHQSYLRRVQRPHAAAAAKAERTCPRAGRGRTTRKSAADSS